MNTLQELHQAEKALLSFVKEKKPSDYVLKKEFCSQNSLDPNDLWWFIDNLLYEQRLERFYEEGSQVPFYRVID